VNRITIDADLGKHKISRHIYGHFSEHLGRCIYDGFWVGEDSSIPNTRGIRNDIVEALRRIKIPNLRWPGGCFADEYHWKDGIGPRKKRPCMVNAHWGGATENNHFGTHEFMDLCEQLDCEPYICGNVGSGTVREMREWIEYLTFDGKSPMADLRRKNGRKEPWKVRFWGVGNESWDCGGSMRPEFYADQFRLYNTYCRNFGGNELYRIACGPLEGDYKWTEVLMREVGRRMNGLSLHYYVVVGTWGHKGSATEFSEEEWFIAMKKALLMNELVVKHSTLMDEFDPEKRVDLIVDEWGTWHDVEPDTNPGFLYQQNTLRDALVAGVTLNIFNRNCERVRMANLAQTVNVLQALILTEGEKMLLTPTYHVFDMYQVHQDATLLPMDLEVAKCKHGNEALPAVSGSASRNAKGQIHVTLCNIDPNHGMNLECAVRGTDVSKVEGRILLALEMNAHNTFEHPDAVQPVEFKGATLDEGIVHIKLPAKSVVVLTLS
jgi:alpha-N-arabinofuranosidase